MFSKALGMAEKYTHPVIYSRRLFDGQVRSGLGSFIVVNSDGWIVTAAHIIQELQKADRDAPALQEFHKKQQQIEQDASIAGKQKRKMQARLERDPEWVTHQVIFWAWQGTHVSGFFINPTADLAIGKLQPFDPDWVTEYPILKDPNQPMLPGTSLCRLGFPFHEIKATFDETNKRFELAPGSLPVPRFPNEGIYTRLAIAITANGAQQAMFIETSSPGLRGQSGGPILDRDGHVWAIQSNTQSLPLGFSPIVKQGSREIVSINLFTSVGVRTSRNLYACCGARIFSFGCLRSWESRHFDSAPISMLYQS